MPWKIEKVDELPKYKCEEYPECQPLAEKQMVRLYSTPWNDVLLEIVAGIIYSFTLERGYWQAIPLHEVRWAESSYRVIGEVIGGEALICLLECGDLRVLEFNGDLYLAPSSQFIEKVAASEHVIVQKN